MIALLYPIAEEVGGKLINNREVRSLLIGIGEKSIQTLESFSGSMGFAVLLGTAAALDTKLRVGDIVVVGSYISLDGSRISADIEPHSLACSILEREGLEFHDGSSLTVPVFGQGIHSNAAMILNMEDFYVAKVLRKRGVPMVTVRIISDLGGRETLSKKELRERIITSGVILRKQFVVPFLKAMQRWRGSEG